MSRDIDDLGMGVTIELKDAFSKSAKEIEKSFDSLDQTVTKKSENVTKHLALMAKGFVTLAVGRKMKSTASRMIQPVIQMGQAFGEVRSVGVKDMQLMANEAIRFSNQWANTSAPAFIAASYDVKSALSDMSDGAVAGFTRFAGITAKATKSHITEMTRLFSIGYGIYNDQFKGFAGETVKGWEAMNKEQRDLEFGQYFSAGMAAVVKNFRTTGPQMAAAMTLLGAQATKANVPFAEQLAILGELQTAMPGSEAATLYASFIKGAAGAQKKLGMSFADSAGRMLPAVEILGKLRDKFGDLSKLEDLQIVQKAFGRAEAKKFIQFLLDKTDSLAVNTVKMADAMKEGLIYTKDMANLMEDTPGNFLLRLHQQAENLRYLIGQYIWPMFRKMLEPLSRAILAIQAFAMQFPGLTRFVARSFVGLSSLLMVVGSIIIAIGAFRGMVPLLNMALASLGFQARVTGRSLVMLFAPLAITFAAFSAFVLAFRIIWTRFDGVRVMITGFIDKIRLVNEVVRTLLGTLIGGYGTISGELYQKLEEAGLVPFAIALFMIAGRVRRFFEGLRDGFRYATQAISGFFDPFIHSILYTLDTFRILIVNFLTGIGLMRSEGMTATEVFYKMGHAIGYYIGRPLVFITKMFSYVANAIGAGVFMLNQFLRSFSIFQEGAAGANVIKTFAQGVLSGFKYLWDAFVSVFKRIVDFLFPHSNARIGPLSTLTEAGMMLMMTLGEGVKLGAKYLWNRFEWAFGVLKAVILAGAFKDSFLVLFKGIISDVAGLWRDFGKTFAAALGAGVRVPLTKVYNSEFKTFILGIFRIIYVAFGAGGLLLKAVTQFFSTLFLSFATFFQTVANENLIARPLFRTLAGMMMALSRFFSGLIDFARIASRTLALNIAEAFFPEHMFKRILKVEKIWAEVLKGLVVYSKRLTVAKMITGVTSGIMNTFGMSLGNVSAMVVTLGRSFMLVFSGGMVGSIARKIFMIVTLVTLLIKVYENWVSVQRTIGRMMFWFGDKVLGLQGAKLGAFVGKVQFAFELIRRALGYFVVPIREKLIKPVLEGFGFLRKEVMGQGKGMYNDFTNYLKDIAKGDFVEYITWLGKTLKSALTLENIKGGIINTFKFIKGFIKGIIPGMRTAIAVWKMYFVIIMWMVKPFIKLAKWFNVLGIGSDKTAEGLTKVEKAGRAAALAFAMLLSLFIMNRFLVIISSLAWMYNGLWMIGKALIFNTKWFAALRLMALGHLKTMWLLIRAGQIRTAGIYAQGVAVGFLTKMFNIVKVSILTVGKAFRWLWVLAMANPFIAIVVAIVAVIGFLVILYKKWEAFRNLVDKGLGWLNNFIVGGEHMLPGSYENTGISTVGVTPGKSSPTVAKSSSVQGGFGDSAALATEIGNAVARAVPGADSRPIVVAIDGREIARTIDKQNRNRRVQSYNMMP